MRHFIIVLNTMDSEAKHSSRCVDLTRAVGDGRPLGHPLLPPPLYDSIVITL